MQEIKVKYLRGINKTIGLLNFDKAIPLYFQTRFGIHTFGLKFPIDVLILDNNNMVVRLTENLKPNKIFLWLPKYNKVIELPAGEIKRKKIKLEQTIKLEFV